MRPRLCLAVVWLLTCLASKAATAQTAKCTFAAVPPLDFVVSGASTNRVWVQASSVECAKTILDAKGLSASTSSGARASARASAPDGQNKLLLALDLRSVSGVTAGNADWTIKEEPGNSAELAHVALRGVAFVPKRLIVTYSDQGMDLKQIGDAWGDEAAGFIAVARDFNPSSTDDKICEKRAREENPKPRDTICIANTAEIPVADHVAHLEERNAKNDLRYQWKIRSSTWGSSIRFHCKDGHEQSDSDTKDCFIRPDRIRFRVAHRLKTSLIVTLELEDQETKKPIVSFPFRIASEARPESLPVPLWLVTSVVCEEKLFWKFKRETEVRNGGVFAVDDDALKEKRCSLKFDFRPLVPPSQGPAPSKGSTNTENDGRKVRVPPSQSSLGKGHFRAYNTQPIEVTIKRGEKSTSLPICVNPHETDPTEFPLSELIGADKESGPYTISVKLVASVDEVFLRKGTLSKNGAHPDEYFEATLRPRGAFGFKAPIRTYVTFPVTPLTFRTPPRSTDLRTSNDSPVLQLGEVRAGAMLVFEPWDYAHNRNLFPIPWSLQAGVSFLQLDKERPVDFFFLAGVSIGFPIIDKSITESSIAIGFFYERDLGVSSKIANQSFIVTVGFDFLRLGKTNTDK